MKHRELEMIWSFSILLECQALGDFIHTLLGIPVPGTVLGMGFLLCYLGVNEVGYGLSPMPATDALLPYLGLFFVPPGVAAVAQLSQLSSFWLPMTVAIVASSILTLIVGGHTAQTLLRRQAHRSAYNRPEAETLEQVQKP